MYGLLLIVIIMIPNIIYMKNRSIKNLTINRKIEFIEEVGRYGSMFFMIFNIGIFNYGYWFYKAKSVYFVLTIILTIVYCVVWGLYFKKATMKRSLLLAILPTLLFLISGIVTGNLFLILFSILFGIAHIFITFHNSKEHT